MRFLRMPLLLALLASAAFAHGGRPYHPDSPTACRDDFPREAWRRRRWEHRPPRWEDRYYERQERIYVPAPPVYFPTPPVRLPAPPVPLPPPPSPLRIHLWFGF